MTERPTENRALQEMGAGINWAYGNGRDSLVPSLNGPLGLSKLKEMVETDETVGSMTWLIDSTLMRAKWPVVPQVDGKIDRTDPKAIEAAAFLESCLGDMTQSFSSHIQEAMTMFWAGFAPCEINLRQRLLTNGSKFNDGFYGLKNIPLRDQTSVQRWDTDKETGEVTGLVQFDGLQSAKGPIPTWKLLHYRTTQELGRPEGRSMLKSCYRIYWLKRRVQDSEAIGIERELCGLPTFYVPSEDIASSVEVEADGVTLTAKATAAQARIHNAIKAVTEMRYNERGGIVIPSDTFTDDDGKPSTVRKWSFEIISGRGQRTIDARSVIRDYDRGIARIALMQFLHLGDRSGGSYALSDNQSGIAIQSLNAFADIIADEFNMKLVRLLWWINRFDQKYMPRLGSPILAEDDLKSLGEFFAKLGLAEAVLAERPDVRDALFERSGMGGDRDLAAEAEARAAKMPPANPPAGGGGGGDE